MDVTIEIRDESMTLVEGRLSKSREMWIGGGITCHIKGSLTDDNYEQARNLFFNYCEDRHIYPSHIHSVATLARRKAKAVETQTRRMF